MKSAPTSSHNSVSLVDEHRIIFRWWCPGGRGDGYRVVAEVVWDDEEKVYCAGIRLNPKVWSKVSQYITWLGRWDSWRWRWTQRLAGMYVVHLYLPATLSHPTNQLLFLLRQRSGGWWCPMETCEHYGETLLLTNVHLNLVTRMVKFPGHLVDTIFMYRGC